MEHNFYYKNDLKIIQISDTHLLSTATELFGFNTNARFKEVIKTIIATDWYDTDFILLTGDLSQDETPGSYRYLVESLKDCLKPIFWIPGNHDDMAVMKPIFSETSFLHYFTYLELAHWIFVFINTKLEGAIHGYIHADDFETIKAQLINAEKTNKKIALIMHHHPTEVNTPLIDQYILDNREKLWRLIGDSKVRLIISGHVHSDYSFIHQGIRIECAPATCFQFQKGADSLQIENTIGYKIHYFSSGNHHSKAVIWEG